jgi:hypothetical protein
MVTLTGMRQVKQRMLKFDDGTIASELKGRSQPTRTVALAAGATDVSRSALAGRLTSFDNDAGSK